MDTLAIAQFGIAPALASALLHSLWQDTLLAIGAALTLSALSGRSAALRHTVGMGFLLAMVLVPAAGLLSFWEKSPLQINEGLLPAMTAMRLETGPMRIVHESGTAAAVVTALWLLGVVLMLVRHVGGLGWLRGMDRVPFEPLPPHWLRRVDELRAALGIAREVSVRLSRDVVAPFTARLLRPVVWLPLSLLTRAPVEQLEALIAHELAHIARMDWLWNGLQCVIEALLFFHPAAWWLGRRIRAEREHACDDLAVAACGDAIALAEALVALERERLASPRLVLAANGGSLMNRITRLLSSPPSRGRWGAYAALGVVLTAGVLLAAQTGFAGNWKPELHVRATTDGPLGPGDMREITASGIDGERYYRVSLDGQGKRTEFYTKNGKVQPIDAGVRNWVAGVERMAAAPIPPPPVPPMPPLPPVPPVPPDPTQTAEFKALLSVIAADSGVLAQLGTALVVEPGSVNGHMNLHGNGRTEGEADLRFEVRGSKGRATIDVEATLEGGRWTLETIELEG